MHTFVQRFQSHLEELDPGRRGRVWWCSTQGAASASVLCGRMPSVSTVAANDKLG